MEIHSILQRQIRTETGCGLSSVALLLLNTTTGYRYANISSEKKIGSGAGMFRVPSEYDTLTVAHQPFMIVLECG